MAGLSVDLLGWPRSSRRDILAFVAAIDTENSALKLFYRRYFHGIQPGLTDGEPHRSVI